MCGGTISRAKLLRDPIDEDDPAAGLGEHDAVAQLLQQREELRLVAHGRLGVLLFEDRARDQAPVEQPRLHPKPRDLGLCVAALERPIDAVEEDLEIEGLAEVVIDPGAHARDRGVGVRVPGDQDDRELGIERPQASTELQAVHARHGEVRDDEVGQLARGFHERGVAAACRGDRERGTSQRRRQRVSDGVVVVDEEDARAGRPFALPPVGGLQRRAGAGPKLGGGEEDSHDTGLRKPCTARAA